MTSVVCPAITWPPHTGKGVGAELGQIGPLGWGSAAFVGLNSAGLAPAVSGWQLWLQR